jgi:hypothetical protein
MLLRINPSFDGLPILRRLLPQHFRIVTRQRLPNDDQPGQGNVVIRVERQDLEK